MPDTSNARLRLREVRQAHGLSQDGLAAKAGLDPVTIRRLERGDFHIHWAMIERLAKALGAEPAELVAEETPAPRPSAAPEVVEP